jgi:hypothetical protein
MKKNNRSSCIAMICRHRGSASQRPLILGLRIGGAMGAIFYTEPFLTFDLDVFAILPRTAGGLLTLAPIYDALRARGYEEKENECVVIEGIPVQFLPAYNSLVEEALDQAPDTRYEDVPTRVKLGSVLTI